MADPELSAEDALMESAGNFMFGSEETPQEPVAEVPAEEPTEVVEEEYEAGQEPQPEGDEVEMVEVQVGEQIIEAPPEIAEILQKHEGMEAAYTEKTQKVAQDRKQLEVNLGLMQQEQAKYEFAASVQDELLQQRMLEEQIQQGQLTLQQHGGTMDPGQYQQWYSAIETAKMQKEAVEKSVATKYQDFQQAQEQSTQEFLSKSTESLKQSIPGWDDAHWGEAKECGIASGYSAAELDQLIDPRAKSILWKAAQYDKIQSGTRPALKKVVAAPRAGTRKAMSKETGDKLNLRKKLKSDNRSDADKAALIGESLKII